MSEITWLPSVIICFMLLISLRVAVFVHALMERIGFCWVTGCKLRKRLHFSKENYLSSDVRKCDLSVFRACELIAVSFVSSARSNMSCTVRWAPLSSCVRSAPRMTRMWRSSPAAIWCAPPVSQPGRYDGVGGFGCRAAVSWDDSLLLKWSAVTNPQSPVSSLQCHILLCYRNRRVRGQDVPSAAVRLRAQSRLW